MVKKSNNPGIVIKMDKSVKNKKFVISLMDEYNFISVLLSSFNVELYEFIKKFELYGYSDSTFSQDVFIDSLNSKLDELELSFTRVCKFIYKKRGDKK